MTSRILRLLSCSGIMLVGQWVQASDIDFERQIRPILANKCYACHGADENHRGSNLRLDMREAALTGGDSGTPAIIPGDPDASELVLRILSDDDGIQMPPASFKKPLTDEEKSLLQQWISAGAEYRDHWAFTAPVRPTVPEDSANPLGDHPVDAFVWEKLKQSNLQPSQPADRAVLFRRLCLDLTGLPPTPEQLASFLADQSPAAYDNAIETLLASPHYGERWGRFWLDAARYADSDGYEKDKPRFVWAYRDYVVDSFNSDLPYNQFIIEQLAGDLLSNPTDSQHIATGFLRNSMINEEGGIDPEQFRMEALFDRMDALGKSVLGLTVQCAQCHDHKFDPISQKEYFQLFAFLNDTHETSIPIYRDDQQVARQLIREQVAALNAELIAAHPDWESELRETLQSKGLHNSDWTVVSPQQEVAGAEKHLILKDGSILAQGYAPTKSTLEFRVTTPQESVDAFRLDFLNHLDLPLNGPGRSVEGSGVLTGIYVDIGPADGSAPLQRMKIASASASVNPPSRPLAAQFDDRSNRERLTGPIEYALDDKDETGWSISAGPDLGNVPVTAVFKLEAPTHFPGGTTLKFIVIQNHGGWNSDDNQTNNLGRFRFSVSGNAHQSSVASPAAEMALLEKPAAQRNFEETTQLLNRYRSLQTDLQPQLAQVMDLLLQAPVPTSQLTMSDRDEHRMTHLLDKGSFLSPRDQVEKGVPEFLPSFDGYEPTRLGLAQWLVNGKNPTVARSLVNRVWQTYFGTGLVATSEDFGLQGDYPSHPELLDWLTDEFVSQGWSLKKLHRVILSSHTYQQSSMMTPELIERDPANRLLARSTRFRMEAEAVRDITLAASGLINLEVGGPPVYPPAPEFLFLPPVSYGPKTWDVSTGPERYRRAIYTFRFRSVPYPALQVFDAPVGETACVRRVLSNTPLQALAALNEPVFVESARALGQLVMNSDCGSDSNCDSDRGSHGGSHGGTDGNSDQKRIELACLRCLGRLPTEQETAILTNFLNQQRDRLQKQELDAGTINAVPLTESSTPEERLAAAELASWTTTCRVILNLDQTITRE